MVLYYAATIVFLVLDFGFNINVRIAALDAFPELRGAYYLVIFACLGLMLLRPAWTTVIGIIESTVTVAALIIHMWLRTMGLTLAVDGAGAGPVTEAEIFNFLLSGSIAYYAWDCGMRDLFGPRK